MSFTMRDLHTALSLCGHTSPGPNGIPYIMLRYGPDESILFLFRYLQYNVERQLCPCHMEVCHRYPVLKTRKDPSIPLHYRPTALTAFIMKLFEKMVNTRLVWVVENGGHVSPVHYGFQRYHCTTEGFSTP